MSKKQKNETSAKAPVKLTRAEKKEIQAVIRKYKGDGKPHSAQASIPYEAMYQDGVCRVTPRTFSKCIEFTDISYQLAQADTKTAIFENLCDLYNYLDASIHVQFSFINRKIDPKQYAKSFEIRAQGDDFDDIRSEYSDILQDQLVNGNNGLMKRKFMTYTIEADSLKMARARLRRIETDLLGYFKSMGASAWGLDAKERLEVMHSIFHPDGEPFSFDWKWLAPSGLSTKDFIAPSSFRFGNARMFGLGGKYGAVSFLQILSPELSDEMLADFLNTENGIVVNLHVQAIDQSDAIKTVKRKITDLDAMKIQEQKRAVRSGYDMDILPSDLATYGQDAKELLKTLQSRNERMFQLTFLVLNTADTRQKLENDVFWAAGIAQKYNCSLVRLDYQQEQGLMSSLPLGASHIQIERSLTTSSVAVFVPFVTQELFQGGDAMYYGINAKTGNMIMLDRKRARCPNGLKLGTPGSGKSMSCKSEILSVFLCTPDDVYICDPEAEYYPLVKRLRGQVVKLSPTSKNYVNPLDINLNYSEDENPLALKSDFVLSFCELVMGGKNGLEAIEKTVIDRAVQVIYRPYLADPKPENMPILADLHKALLDQHIPEADRVAQALDLYVSGSLNVFNHRTNIDIQNRIVAFDIKELGKQLKKIGMLIVQDQIWGRVTQNRSKGKATWYFCDEFHLLLREEQTAAFSCEIWKRFRKWGGIPTGATQNVKDLLSSPEIENILENSDFICLLNQASGDRKILAERLNISPQQLRYVDNSEPGEGLLIYENVILPFKNPIPKNTQLYDNLYQSALCRAQADWLVGINATRLFSILYHKTLTVGRVQTPTLKMLVDREAKINSFQKEKYHIVQIAAGGMEAASERMGNADDAKVLKAACETAQAVCVSVTREKKTEQPPRLYDLTTLQREANRLFGFTAKQTLDYAQQLYEKKLLTYPRTDSQYLTDDMLPTAESLVSGLWPLLPFAAGLDLSPQFGRVLNSKKVSDHHAIVPTMEFVQKGFDGLTEGEKKLLSLVCCKLLCAVAAPHVYEAVTATFTCAGNTFTAKGKTILTPGWKELDRRFKASFKTDADDTAPEPARELPQITEGQTFDKVTAAVTEHFTTPPKSYTEAICCERGIRNRP